MNPKQTGLVALEDLPEKEIFVFLDKKERVYLVGKIKKKDKLTSFLSKLSVLDWFYGQTKFLRLDKFKKLLKELGFNYFKIRKFRMKQGIFIKNRSFDFTSKKGVRFMAALFGDGCIHKKGIRYYNKDRILINDFIEASKNIFGDIRIRVNQDKKECFSVSLPIICKLIINQLGFQEGSKIINNMQVPKFLFNLENEKLLEFISKLVDDEGFIIDGKLCVDMAFMYNEEPKFLYDLKILLKSLDVNCSVFPATEYSSKSGKKRMWRLGIFSFREICKIGSGLNLQHKSKRLKLKKILSSPRQTPYKDIRPYVMKMKEIQDSKGFFTILELANLTERSVRQCKRIVLNMKKMNLISLNEYGGFRYNGE